MAKSGTLTIPEIPMPRGATTHEIVYARLRQAIMTGSIAPGTVVTMRGLAEHLRVSPTPIREAVRQLGSENALEAMGNRRYRIPPMTAGRFEELLLLRIAVEVHAAERALPYVSGVLMDRLQAVDAEMDAVLEAEDLDRLTLLNQRFHRLLYTCNPHQAAMPMVESVWLQLGPFQRQVIRDVKSYYVVDRHKEIVAALERRDAAMLALAVESDIRDTLARAGRAHLMQALRDAG
ncbi:GntR family transcriptional regulator [Stappia sp.]|uniref:GntR family transcriptional regulator n=1 Tax=Stappia sp. TaxID=1870903 RepID=UPI0032D8EC6F